MLKRSVKQMLSFLLALLLVLGDVPVTVYAETTEETSGMETVMDTDVSGDESVSANTAMPEEGAVEEKSDPVQENRENLQDVKPMDAGMGGTIEVSDFATLKKALEADTENTVRLVADISYTMPKKADTAEAYSLLVKKGKHILDLNGKKLAFYGGQGQESPSQMPIGMEYAQLTICDNSAAKAGQLLYQVNTEAFGGYYSAIRVYVADNCALNLRDITLVVKGGDGLQAVSSGAQTRIENCTLQAPGRTIDFSGQELNIKNSSIISEKDVAVYAASGTLLIESGIFQAKENCLDINSTKTTIQGGTFQSEERCAAFFRGGQTVIEGGSYTALGTVPAIWASSANSGGNFKFKVYAGTLETKGRSFLTVQTDHDEQGLTPFIPASSVVKVGGTQVTRASLSENSSLQKPAENAAAICEISDNRADPNYQITDVSVTLENNIYGKNIAAIKATSTTADVTCSVSWEKMFLGTSYGTVSEGIFNRRYDFCATICLTSEEKWFPEDIERMVKLNGNVVTDYTIEDGNLYLTHSYSSPNKLQVISVNVTPPMAGDPLAVNVEYPGTFRETPGEQAVWETTDTKALQGKTYYLTIPVSCTGDYYLDQKENLSISVNRNNEAWKPVSMALIRQTSSRAILQLGFKPMEKQPIHVTGGVALDRYGRIITEAAVGELVQLSPALADTRASSGWEGLEGVVTAFSGYSTVEKQFFYMMGTPKFYMPDQPLDVTALTKEEGTTYVPSVDLHIDLYAEDVLPSTATTASAEYTVGKIIWKELTEAGEKVVTDRLLSEEKEYIVTLYLSEVPGKRKLTDQNALVDSSRLLGGTVNGWPVFNCGKVIANGVRYASVSCYVGRPGFRVEAESGVSVQDPAGNAIRSADRGSTVVLSTASEKKGTKFRYWTFLERTEDGSYIPMSSSEIVFSKQDGRENPDASFVMPGKHVKAVPVYATDEAVVDTLHLDGVQKPEYGKKLDFSGAAADAEVESLQSGWVVLKSDPKAWEDYPAAWDLDMIEDTDTKAEYGIRYGYLVTVILTDEKVFPDQVQKLQVDMNGKKADKVFLSRGKELYVLFDYGTLCPEGLWIRPQEETSYVYTGQAVKPEVEAYCDGVLLKAGTDYTISYKNNVKAAKKDADKAPTIILTGKKNYKGKVTTTFTIEQAEFGVTPGIEAEDLVVTETGKQIFAKPVIRYNGKAIPTSEYTVEYVNKDDLNRFCKPGSYSIRITGKNLNFKGSFTLAEKVIVKPVKLTAKNLEWKVTSKVYTGSSQELYRGTEYRLTDGNGKELNVGTDYTITYANNVNVGKATVTFTGTGAYTGTLKKTFSILPRPLARVEKDKSLTILAEIQNPPQEEAFDRNGVRPEGYLLSLNGTRLIEGKDYTVTHGNSKKVADKEDTKAPYLQIKGKGNYTGSFQVKYSICAADLSESSFTASAKDLVYQNQKKYATSLTVQDGKGRTLSQGRDYIVKNYQYQASGVWADITETGIPFADGQAEQWMRVTIAGTGNYTGERTCEYRISRYGASQLKLDKIADQLYTGEAIEPYEDLVVRDGKTKEILSIGTDYKITGFENNLHAGTATVQLQGMGAYSGTLKGTFRIKPAVLATQDADGTQTLHSKLTVLQKTTAVPYSGAAQKLTDFEVRFGGQLLQAGKDYSISYKNNVKPGDITKGLSKAPTVILGGKGDYSGKLMLDFTILPGELKDCSCYVKDVVYKDSKNNYVSAITLVTASGRKLKAGTDYEKLLKYEVKEGGSWKEITADRVTLGSEKQLALRVTVQGKGLYQGSITAEYRMCGKNMSQVTVDKVPDQIYTGGEICPALSVKNQDGAFLTEGTDYTLTYSNNVKTGTATVVLTGKGEYAGEKKITFRIVTHQLTWWESITYSIHTWFL